MGMLTPEDGEILTKAIREALPEPAPPPPKPSLRGALLRLAAAIGVGFVLAGIVWWFLGWLLGTHVALRTSVTSSDPDQITRVSMRGLTAGWRADQIAMDRVTILPPSDVIVSLPIPIEACPQLPVGCTDGQITGIDLPAELTFDHEVTATATSPDSKRLALDRLVSATEPDSLVLGLLTSGAPVELRFTVTEVTTLTITSAGEDLDGIRLDPADGGLAEDQRVGLRLGDGQSESNLVLEHVSTVQGLTAEALSGEIAGFVGKIVVFGSGTTLIDPATTVSMLGDASDPVVAHLSIGSSSTVQFDADPVSSVKTDEGELLPTRYANRPQFWGPVVAALMGGLVLELTVGQLGAFAKGLLDKVGKVAGG